MKKIISLLAATMMMFSFATISQAEGNISVTISDATVELNAADATVDVTYTFDFPEEVSIIGFQPEVTFDKTALKLNSYTLSGDGVEWSTSDSNTNAAYGAYLSFDDTSFEGTTATNQYVMTLNFTVVDVTTAAEYTVGLQNLVGTDSGWTGLGDNYGLDIAKEGKITVGENKPSTPDAVKFYAVLPACKKAEASAVAQFQFDSNADGVADKGYNYDLGSLTWDTDVTVGVQVEEIDDGVTLALTNVLWK